MVCLQLIGEEQAYRVMWPKKMLLDQARLSTDIDQWGMVLSRIVQYAAINQVLFGGYVQSPSQTEAADSNPEQPAEEVCLSAFHIHVGIGMAWRAL